MPAKPHPTPLPPRPTTTLENAPVAEAVKDPEATASNATPIGSNATPSIALPLRELSDQAQTTPLPPATDPEHGDLTPDYVRWFLHHHSEDECFAKYGTRLDKLPPDCRPTAARLPAGLICHPSTIKHNA